MLLINSISVFLYFRFLFADRNRIDSEYLSTKYVHLNTISETISIAILIMRTSLICISKVYIHNIKDIKNIKVKSA